MNNINDFLNTLNTLPQEITTPDDKKTRYLCNLFFEANYKSFDDITLIGLYNKYMFLGKNNTELMNYLLIKASENKIILDKIKNYNRIDDHKFFNSSAVESYFQFISNEHSEIALEQTKFFISKLKNKNYFILKIYERTKKPNFELLIHCVRKSSDLLKSSIPKSFIDYYCKNHPESIDEIIHYISSRSSIFDEFSLCKNGITDIVYNKVIQHYLNKPQNPYSFIDFLINSDKNFEQKAQEKINLNDFFSKKILYKKQSTGFGALEKTNETIITCNVLQHIVLKLLKIDNFSKAVFFIQKNPDLFLENITETINLLDISEPFLDYFYKRQILFKSNPLIVCSSIQHLLNDSQQNMLLHSVFNLLSTKAISPDEYFVEIIKNIYKQSDLNKLQIVENKFNKQILKENIDLLEKIKIEIKVNQLPLNHNKSTMSKI